MSHHPRIEEVSDSGTESDSDPDVVDIDSIALPTRPNPSQSQNASLMDPSRIPTQASQQPARPRFDPNTAKKWIALYPVYFDASRSRHEGRRVGKEHAVDNPMARTIADAVVRLGFQPFLDISKTHPKDWANPGRIKVDLKDEDGNLRGSNIKNSMFW